jgi:hypothetical protein
VNFVAKKRYLIYRSNIARKYEGIFSFGLFKSWNTLLEEWFFNDSNVSFNFVDFLMSDLAFKTWIQLIRSNISVQPLHLQRKPRLQPKMLPRPQQPRPQPSQRPKLQPRRSLLPQQRRLPLERYIITSHESFNNVFPSIAYLFLSQTAAKVGKALKAQKAIKKGTRTKAVRKVRTTVHFYR